MKTEQNKFYSTITVTLGLSIMVLAIVQACDSSGDMETKDNIDNSSKEKEEINVLPILDKLELDKGMSVTFEKGPNDSNGYSHRIS